MSQLEKNSGVRRERSGRTLPLRPIISSALFS